MFKFKRIKNLYTSKEKKESERLDNWYNYIQRNKRVILNSFIVDQNFINELITDENKFIKDNKLFLSKTKPKIYDNIIDLKENKYKKRFINSNKSSLPKDILNIVYEYYEENPYIFLIKLKNISNYLITNKKKFLKNIFLNNEISLIYRLNGNKIVNYFQKEIFNNVTPKIIYHYDLGIYSKVNLNYKIINDFYSPLISIKIYYFKKNYKKIKYRFFNLTNYNNLYFINNFLKKNFLTKYEFFFIKTFNYYKLNRSLISLDDIKKYDFLKEIDEYLYKYLDKISNYKN